MIVSQDWQEISVFECILGSLHIGVEVESEPQPALDRICKSKVDALIVDCDLNWSQSFMRQLHEGVSLNPAPVMIVSGAGARQIPEAKQASFVVEKPVSVEKAVHTLSAARNMILEGRLRYHRQALEVPVSITDQSKQKLTARLLNLSQGGLRLRVASQAPLTGQVQVNFALPGSNCTLSAEGIVTWSDKKGNAGVHFVQMGAAMKRDLQLWLERRYFES